MVDGKIRNQNHITDTRALRFLHTAFPPEWVPREMTPDYGIDRAIVFSNEREVSKKKGVTYLPIYYCMFLQDRNNEESITLPELESV
jgi:hypothetical protein